MNRREVADARPPRRPHYTPGQLAEPLNMPAGTLRNWRDLGEGPTFYRLGRSVRYDPADVDAWLAARRVP